MSIDVTTTAVLKRLDDLRGIKHNTEERNSKKLGSSIHREKKKNNNNKIISFYYYYTYNLSI